MKWLSGLATALFASTTLAAPVAQAEDLMTVYNLKLAVRSDVFLDGKYLSSRGGKVGVFNSQRPVHFYTSPSPSRGLLRLHTWPIGIVDSVLGLVGSGGLTALSEISNPETVTYPVGTQADWTSWAMVEAGSGSRVGPTRNLLDYAGSRTGRWVAFPRGHDEWIVTWLEGTTFVPQNYIEVDVIYEVASDKTKYEDGSGTNSK